MASLKEPRPIKIAGHRRLDTVRRPSWINVEERPRILPNDGIVRRSWAQIREMLIIDSLYRTRVRRIDPTTHNLHSMPYTGIVRRSLVCSHGCDQQNLRGRIRQPLAVAPWKPTPWPLVRAVNAAASSPVLRSWTAGWRQPVDRRRRAVRRDRATVRSKHRGPTVRC